MAKDSDKTTGTLGAEKAGGKLSGLLADEREFDRRALWRIGWWGTAAVGTLIVAMLVNQGAQSWRQDRISAADLARHAQLIQSLARDTQNESRQLAAAIETLNSDRDRLYARVTVLEQSLDSVTGSLAKPGMPQASAGIQSSAKPPASASPAPPPTQLAAADEQQSTAAKPPLLTPGAPAIGTAAGTSGLSAADSSVVAPAVEPITTTGAIGGERTRAEQAKPQPSSAMSAMAAAPATSASASAASLVAPKSIMGPPDPAARGLTEPDKVAKLDATAKPMDGAPDAVHKTEFAVDLGSANSISGLRALWRGLSKTNSDLATLRPIIMLKEGSTGLGMQLRLGAGPLSDAAAAAKICARLSESQRPCETTVYDGQRLTARSDDSEAGPGAAKQPEGSEQKPAPNTAGTPPTYQRRRGTYQPHRGASREPQAAQPAAAPQPQPQPQQPESKSEPSTLSSLFRGRNGP